MPTVQFLGHVLPLTLRLSFQNIPPVRLEAHDGLTAEITIHLNQSRIEVICETNRFNDSDLGYLYIRTFDITRATVNIVAFATGYGLSLHLHQFVDPTGYVGPLNIQHLELARYCTAYKMNAGTEQEKKDITQICSIVFLSDPALYVALNDLVESITFPHGAPVNCARAMDALRNLPAPGLPKEQGWSIMHAALHIDLPYVKFISKQSRGPRHADHAYMPEGTVKAIVERSWIIMNRYLELRKRNNQLPFDEFPLLTDDSALT